MASPSRLRKLIVTALVILISATGLIVLSQRRTPHTLTEETFKNIAYGNADEGDPMTLRDGNYSEPVTWSERFETLSDWVKGDAQSPIDYRATRAEAGYEKSAVGTVKKTPLAAVVHWESGGGSGTFYTLSSVIISDGKAVITGTVYLGDRPDVQSVRFDGEHLLLDIVRAGPGDSASDPTEHVLLTYAFNAALSPELISTRPLLKIPPSKSAVTPEEEDKDNDTE